MANQEGLREKPVRRIQWQLIAVFVFGVVFLLLLMGVAIFQPNPTTFSRLIFGLVAALAAGGVAALLPGAISVKLPLPVRAGGALGVTVLIFYAFWQGFPDQAPPDFALPNGVETGWVFVGYVNRQDGTFIEGPYVSIEDTKKKAKARFVELGDRIKLKVDRELIITDYKNGGSDPMKSPTEVPGGATRPADRTGFKLPKGSEWVVRDVVVAGFAEATSDANWVRISAVPR